MQYVVKFVEDTELPPGLDFVLVTMPDGICCAYIKGSKVSPVTLAEAWGAFSLIAPQALHLTA